MSSQVEKKFLKKVHSLDSSVTPGFCLTALVGGKTVIDIQWGKVWPYYDLASLTKIFFTTSFMMKLTTQKKIKLQQNVQEILPWYPKRRTIAQLLTHTAGNEWWRPYYKSINVVESLYERQLRLQELLAHTPIASPGPSVYSDLDFFVLGFILQNLMEKDLFSLWKQFCDDSQWQRPMHFNLYNKSIYEKNQYAPTERCPWRKRILQGEVHDENAWSLGGVAPHAGLFGNISSVVEWSLWLRTVLMEGTAAIDSATAKRFARRATPEKSGDWAYGFMMPTKGKASCGKYFSLKSIGHTGFTGTSFWFDPIQDIIIIILSNRVHPTRKNELWRNARPWIHDMVMESLKE